MPSGGVCAVLDYKVDMMAEYVSEMAVRLVTPQSPVTAPFKKFVSQILSSTRLPKSTIMLGMNYLAKRTNVLNASGTFQANEGQVWRMLTVALLLGSKFLDDNTFRNRSWSEVSNIPVQDLNSMETQWVLDSDWRMYVNLDRSEDYTAWLSSWDNWDSQKTHQAAQAKLEKYEKRAALVAPIDTDLNRSRSGRSTWGQLNYPDYDNMGSIKRSEQVSATMYRHQGVNWNPYSAGAWASATPITPDSGYGTPEDYNMAVHGHIPFHGDCGGRMYGSHSQSQQATRQYYPAFQYYSSSRSHYYADHHNRFSQNAWDESHVDCACVHCTNTIHNQQHSLYGSRGQLIHA